MQRPTYNPTADELRRHVATLTQTPAGAVMVEVCPSALLTTVLAALSGLERNVPPRTAAEAFVGDALALVRSEAAPMRADVARDLLARLQRLARQSNRDAKPIRAEDAARCNPLPLDVQSLEDLLVRKG